MVNIIRLVVELNDYHDNSRICYMLDESVVSSPSSQSFVVLVPNHITISEALAIIVKKHNEIYLERPPLFEQGIYLHHTGINTDIRDASIRLCDIFDEWGKGVWSPRVKIVCKPDTYKNNAASKALSCPSQHSQDSALSNVYDSTAIRSPQNYFTSPDSIAIQNRGSQIPSRTQDKKNFCSSSLSSSSSSKLAREIRKYLKTLKKKISARKNLDDKSKTDLVIRKTSTDYSPCHSLSTYNERAKKVPRDSYPHSPAKCVSNQTKTSPYLRRKRRRDETMLLQFYSDELHDQGTNYQADTAIKKLHLSDKKKQKNEGSQQQLNKVNHYSTFSNVNESEREKKSTLEKNLSTTKHMDSSAAESASELSVPPITGKNQVPPEDSQSVISSQTDPLITSSSVPQHREDKKPANPIHLHYLLNDHKNHIDHQLFDDNKKRKGTDQRLHAIVDVSTKYTIRKRDSDVVDSQSLGNEHTNNAEKQNYVKNEDQSTKKYIESSSQKQKQQKDLDNLLTTPISDPNPNCSSKNDKSEKIFDLQNPDSSASLSDSSSSEDNEEQIATFKKYTSGLHSNLTAHVQEKTVRKNYKGVFSSSDPPGPFKNLKKMKSIIDKTD